METTGPNQHFIPQSLLRLFRISPTGKVARVNVYRADRSHVSPTDNVAAQRHFYSEGPADEGEPLDTLITRYEAGPHNTSFLALTSSPSGPVNASDAARVVAHLAGRGDHFRGMVRTAATAMADLLENLFGDPNGLAQLVGADGPVPGPRFREVFRENIAGNALLSQLGIAEQALESLAFVMLRENQADSSREIGNLALGLADNFRSSAGSIARNAQVKALTDTLAPDERIAKLAAFNWRIVDMVGPGAILPDFVMLARDAEGHAGNIFTFDSDQLAEVLMPLGPKRMLVGQRIERDPRLGDFNAEAAPLCRAFFVSAYIDPALEALAASIGQDADTLVYESLERAASDFRARLDTVSTAPVEGEGAWRATTGRGFDLETDHLSTDDAERLGNILGQIVGLARARFDTDTLRRIVVRQDYAAAIAAVDRGAFDDGVPLEPSNEGVSVAYNIVVERDGDAGIVIVLQAGIGEMLLGNDGVQFAAAAATVLGRLAYLGADMLIGTVFADGIVIGGQRDRYLLGKAVHAWKTWLVASFETMFSDEVAPWYRETLEERLRGFSDRLAELRRAYRVEGNLDGFMLAAADEAMNVLTAAARAAAVSRDDEATAAFRETLAVIGWDKWFALLEGDLAAIWSEGLAYPPQDAFLVLSYHLQRLLAAGAIFLSDLNDEQFRIEVPHWSDLDWMLKRLADGDLGLPEPGSPAA